jgi:hypothetical protein
MKIPLSFLFSFSLLSAFSQSDEFILERALSNLPNVSFKKTSEPGDVVLTYDLLIKQPLDHAHPEKGFFNQRVALTHKGFSNTMVMQTQGYWLAATNRNEIDKLCDANDLNIEYRFCGKSLPDSMQWEYLTEEQATADLHVVNQLFRNIYKGKWISTGISKGGSTTIYYKYFYPADVDLSIPYVAPLDNNLEDLRIYEFLDTMGAQDCRNKIREFQVFLLKHENEVIEKLKWHSKGADVHYTYTGSIGKSFEYAVLEYPFAFWQYYVTNNCDSIPTNNSLDEYLSALLKTSDIRSFSDEGIKMFEAHYYQAATQCGYYGYNIGPFKKYLHYFTENPSAAFPSKSVAVKPFDGTLNQKVQEWLAENGNNIIYIYGGYDTWTSAGITLSNKVNSKKFVIPNTNHATARVKNMDAAMQQEFTQSVKKLGGINVTF